MGRGARRWLGVTLLLTLGACHGPQTRTIAPSPQPGAHTTPANHGEDGSDRASEDSGRVPEAPDPGEDKASEGEVPSDRGDDASPDHRDDDRAALENRGDADQNDIAHHEADLDRQAPAPTTSPEKIAEVTLPPAATSWPAPFKRSLWPHAPWVQARAYTYNFRPYGPGPMLRVYQDGRWSDTLRDTLALTPSQAAAALELTHRTRGEAHISSCPFPRHAVVFFDEADQPVGSVSVCFACGDILVWPPYFTDARLEDRKHALAGPGELTRVGAAQEEVMPLWQQLFDGAGAARYTGPLR